MVAARTAFVVFAALATVTAVAAAPACRSKVSPGQVGTDASSPASVATLPALALSPRQAADVARIQLERPDDDDPTRRTAIVLERRGDAWFLTAPLRARASADKVSALLANLQDLHLSRRLDPGTAFYERFDLTDAKALHVVARTAAGQQLVNFLAGKSSEQGQLVRLPGVPGLFALANDGPHGYQGFLYTRDLRSWRDPGLLSFDEADVDDVEIANPHGAFRFRRDVAAEPGHEGAGWRAVFAPRRTDGKLGSPRAAWPRFDAGRLEEMLHAYHALAADDFGLLADRADSGLDDAERAGGVVRIHLSHAPAPLVLRVGAPAPARSRFAVAGSRWAAIGEAAVEQANDDAPYTLSPWTARWAVSDVHAFERPR